MAAVLHRDGYTGRRQQASEKGGKKDVWQERKHNQQRIAESYKDLGNISKFLSLIFAV